MNRLWLDRVGYGLYPERWEDGDAVQFCYSPLEVGLLVGAWRELAAISPPAEAQFLLERVASFLRTILDEAALQLSNALPRAANLVYAGGATTIAGIPDDSTYGLAPVLQQQLCLTDSTGTVGSVCAGRTILVDEPWYQTDIAMYTGYVLQQGFPALEDYADADLISVLLYSGVGEPSVHVGAASVDAIAADAGWTGNAGALDPVILPYAGASPVLRVDGADEGRLQWIDEGADRRLLSSALGMTLLRASQEAMQLAVLSESGLGAEQRFVLDWLAEVIISQADAVFGLIETTALPGTDTLSYVPSEYDILADPIGSPVVTALSSDSHLFDFAAVLLGLSEFRSFLESLGAETATNLANSGYAIDGPRIAAAVSALLDTVGRSYLHDVSGVWTDRNRGGLGWQLEEESPESGVSTESIAWIAVAIEKVAESFADHAEIAAKARELCRRVADFVQDQLSDGRGGYIDQWPNDRRCETLDFGTQLAAIRALAACADVLGDPLLAERVIVAVRAVDVLFWDGALRMYDSTFGSEHERHCYSPVDLAWSLELIDRARKSALEASDSVEARIWACRIDDWGERLLDAARLHLPPEGWQEGLSEDGSRQYASVFSQRVCLPAELPATTDMRVATAGDLILYSMEVENETDETWFDLRLADTLPPGVDFVSASPAASIDGDKLEWRFDRLSPSETRRFEILAQIGTGSGTDELLDAAESLLNCVQLTYATGSGESGFTREACAEISMGSALADADDLVEYAYKTDEAMYLATALDAAAVHGMDHAFGPWIPGLLASNVGVLVSESGMGIEWRNPNPVETGVEMGSQLLIPYAEGVPWLRLGEGFVSTDRRITPAALGQTLAAEAALHSRLSESASAYTTVLREYVDDLIFAQLDWLSEQLVTLGNPLPHVLRRLVESELLGIGDPQVLLYDQASLLWGVASVAVSMPIPSRSRQRAELLIEDTVDAVLEFWNPRREAFVRMYDPATQAAIEHDSPMAPWIDQVVAAKALARASLVPGVDTVSVRRVLAALATTALDDNPQPSLVDEASRLMISLLGMGQASAERLSQQQSIVDAWAGRVLGSLESSNQSLSPREWAVIVDLLVEAMPTVGSASVSLRSLDDTVINGNGEWIGTVLPTWPRGFWWEHAELVCEGWAPVFVVRNVTSGNDP